MKCPKQFIVKNAIPAYLTSEIRASFPERVMAALDELSHCQACPRCCAVNRSEEETGFCGVGRSVRVASAYAHFGEEDCLRGTRGSGTIFFAGCNLGCVFCQNWNISQRQSDQEMNAGRLAELMLSLQEAGCHNVNLVTPSHVVPQIVEALVVATDAGLRLPVVYNTGAYDSLSSLALLDGLIDIYMPDFKFWTPEIAERLANAPGYPQRAREAIHEMYRQVGDLHFTPDGVACRGLLIRQLVMPGMVAESREVYRWLADEISPDTFVNIMAQYRPENRVGQSGEMAGESCQVQYTEINRRPTRAELTAACEAARETGLWRFDERCLSREG